MKINITKKLVIRVISVIFAVIMMGFALSWLVLVDLGTDPCTALNLAIASKLGLSIGNWQAIFNTVLIILVFIFDKHYIGIGTVANMYLVGYSLQFFSSIWNKVLPEGLFDNLYVKLLVLIPALMIFVLAAAVYMDVNLGTAPYDALSFIISDKLPKFSVKAVRIAYDLIVIVAAFLLGGAVGLVTFLIAFTLGPAIEYVGKYISKLI